MLPDKHGLSPNMYLDQVMMTLHFLNDVANDAESTQKKTQKKCVIVVSFKIVQQWVNWLIEYQVCVFWYQV